MKKNTKTLNLSRPNLYKDRTINRLNRTRIARLSLSVFSPNKPNLIKRLIYRNSLKPKVQNPSPFPFVDNRKDKVCKDRQVRREVLFAKGKQGGNHKPPTYTTDSLIRCN